jgi:hypothetical protein
MGDHRSEGEHHLATGLAALERIGGGHWEGTDRSRLVRELEELALHRDFIEYICEALVEVGPWTLFDDPGHLRRAETAKSTFRDQVAALVQDQPVTIHIESSQRYPNCGFSIKNGAARHG